MLVGSIGIHDLLRDIKACPPGITFSAFIATLVAYGFAAYASHLAGVLASLLLAQAMGVVGTAAGDALAQSLVVFATTTPAVNQ